MLVVTTLDDLDDEKQDLLARTLGGIGVCRPNCFYDLEKSTIFDYPPEGCKVPKELLTKDSNNLLFKTIGFNHIEEEFLGHYWDVKALDLSFTFCIMDFERYMDANGYFHIHTTCAYSALVVFNFDSKADAMLAKLGLEELRSISVEDYRRLLGEIGQPAVDLPI